MSLSLNDFFSRCESLRTFGTEFRPRHSPMRTRSNFLGGHAREQRANSLVASFVVRFGKWTATLPASEERAIVATIITITLVANYQSLECPSAFEELQK